MNVGNQNKEVEGVVGKKVEQLTNKNWEGIIELCIENNSVIANSKSKHKCVYSQICKSELQQKGKLNNRLPFDMQTEMKKGISNKARRNRRVAIILLIMKLKKQKE